MTAEGQGGGGDGPFSPFKDAISTAFLNPSDDTVLDQQGKDIANKIISKEQEKDASLLSLIEYLGPQLTSTNVQERVKAVDILARVFGFLPKDFLSEKELEFIVEFLRNRMKDQHLVVPKAILCCLPIVQCQNLPKGLGVELLQRIFEEVNVQSHIHRIRRTVFLIIDFLLRNKLEELLELSTDFIINFLQSMDGEKDPRNLLLLFQLVPLIISKFNLGPFIEDFFEILGCYFPIDFSPTVNIGGTVITREMLASALHNCLSHTNKFSPFLIPLALEKLDSSLVDAKIDSLRLLELCCLKCYQPGNLQPFLPQLWHSLRREIFMGGSESVEKQSIAFLQAAFRVVSEDEGVLAGCVDLIFTECRHHLCEPELRLVQPTSRILVAMCSASEKSCSYMAPRVFTVLHEQLVKTGGIQSERKRIMEITEMILASCRQFPKVSLMPLLENPDKWDEMLVTWFSFLSSEDPDFVHLSLKILLRVLQSENEEVDDEDFPPKYRTLLQEHLLFLLNNQKHLSPEAFSTMTKIVETLVIKHGPEFGEVSVPKLLDLISASESTTTADLSSQLLGECCSCNEIVFEKVVASLLSKICSSSTSNSSLLPLQCLNRIVEKVVVMKAPLVKSNSRLISTLIEKLGVFDKVFELSLSSRMNREMSPFCVTILRNLVRGSGEMEQGKVMEKSWKVKAKKEIPLKELFVTEGEEGIPFPVAESIIGNLRRSVDIYRRDDLVDYLLEQGLCDALLQEEKVEDVYPYQRLLSVLINKSNDSDFPSLLGRVQDEIERNLGSLNSLVRSKKKEEEGSGKGEGVGEEKKVDLDISSSASPKTLCCISLLSWITKGLAMKGTGELGNWVDKMIELLQYEGKIGQIAASGFDILLRDDETSLNPRAHCNYRFLYKQRVFQMSVPKLVERYRGSKSNIAKANFIQALSCQLKYIPKDVLAMEIENVFPLLIASMKLDSSPPLLSSTLKAFTEMMVNSDSEMDKRLVEYCFDIVPRLSQLTGYEGDMDVRIMALQCLQKCAKCPIHVIQPLRQEVIDELSKCLDDRKRLVRSEARKTRNFWILVGSPGGL